MLFLSLRYWAYRKHNNLFSTEEVSTGILNLSKHTASIALLWMLLIVGTTVVMVPPLIRNVYNTYDIRYGEGIPQDGIPVESKPAPAPAPTEIPVEVE